MTDIRKASRPEHFAQARLLFEAYRRSLDFSLEFQCFDGEVETLPGCYAAPKGCILLAFQNLGKAVGCVALRPLEQGICEMKRLYTLPEVRGHGAGRALAVAVIDEAQAQGYAKMRLDTVEALHEANLLYASLGFRPIEAYCHNPLPDARFFELVF